MQIAIILNELGLPELMLIELQGVLEMHQNLAGIEFGKLHWGLNATVYLCIEHNQYEGKFVNLEKPMLVIDKSTKNFQLDKNEMPEVTIYKGSAKVEGIIERKLLFKTRPRPIIGASGAFALTKSVNKSNIFGKQ